MNTIYLVRHGDYTHDGGGLTMKGVKQAIEIGLHLDNVSTQPYIIYTSPILRARMTADHIAQHIDSIALIKLDQLREIESGESWDELAERAKTALGIATISIECDIVIVSHRALIQAMLSPILGKQPRDIAIEKGHVYELSTSGEMKVKYEDRWGT